MVQVRRPPKAGQDPHTRQKTGNTGVRLGPDLRARLDALVVPMSAPWHKATASDVLRAVVMAGLPVVEARYARKKGGA